MAGRAPTAYRVPSRGGPSRAGGAPMTNIQDVAVAHRPLSNHGVTGPTGNVKGQGRSVFDKTYYLGVLPQKITELKIEIENFQEEMEDINRNADLYKNLEKQREDLIKEVRNSEGELADYNLTLDKMRAGTPIEEVLSTFEYIQMQNMRQREEVDKLFIDRKRIEEEIARIDMEIASMNAQAEERLGELEPDQRNEYFQLQMQNKQLEEETQQKKQMLEAVNQRLAYADSKLRTDVMKQKANQLREQRLMYDRRREDLRLQTNELNLSFPEARERLLARVKTDNQTIKESELRIREIEKAVVNYKKQVEEIENELKSSDTSHVEKFDALAKRDAEMTQFIDAFETTKKSELEMIRSLEDNIAATLEVMAKSLDWKENLPSEDKVQEWKSELDYKMKHATNAAVTMERLKKELEDRQADLERAQNLDQMLPKQIESFKQKTAQMEEELRTKYNDFDQMKQANAAELERLRNLKEHLGKKKDTMMWLLRTLGLKYDTKRQQLRDNKITKDLEDDEKKMSMNEQTMHSLKSYIDSKGAETNYQPLQGDCRSITQDINNLLLTRYG